MTKTTEELKHEMFDLLSMVKHQTAHVVTMRIFEESLEAYLEALRQEAEGLTKQGCILIDAYTHQQALTMQARAEADSYRNKLQAFEFANQSAGEFLKEARTKVKAQRQSIGQLKNERDNAVHALKVKTSKLEKALQELQEARQVIGSTIAQNRRDLISCAKCGGSGLVLIGMHKQGCAPMAIECAACAHLRWGDAALIDPKCAHSSDHNGVCIYCRQKVGGVV